MKHKKIGRGKHDRTEMQLKRIRQRIREKDIMKLEENIVKPKEEPPKEEPKKEPEEKDERVVLFTMPQ